jgi:predicted dehydrogenase
MKTVGIGIIGSGSIAQAVHLPAYKKLQDEGKVKIVAICDIIEKVGKDVADKYGVDRVFADYHDLLKLDEIDAVDVCTPNCVHKQPVIDALRAGKHAIVEKPIALNAIEGAAMVAASHAAGKKLQVGLNMRFGSGPQAAKRLIRDGKMGEIYYARAQALRRRGIPGWGMFTQKDKQGGGPLIDIGVHILDLTLWLMDYPEPARVSGTTYTKFGTREGLVGMMGKWDPKIYSVEDFGVGLIKFKNGATIVLESSFAANIEHDQFVTQIMGTEGGAFIDPGNNGNTKFFTEESGSLIDSKINWLPVVATHEAEIRSFVNAIQQDLPVDVPGEHGVMVSRILDAIYESGETGKEIVL